MLKIILATLLLTAASTSASASAKDKVECPKDLEKTACVYYKEGFAVGKDDAESGAKHAYQRHEDSYDSRYETAFSSGYDLGFKKADTKN